MAYNKLHTSFRALRTLHRDMSLKGDPRVHENAGQGSYGRAQRITTLVSEQDLDVQAQEASLDVRLGD